MKIKLVANVDNKISPRLNKLLRINNVASNVSGDLRTSKTRFEEIDLCRRLRSKSKKIFLDSNIIVYHPKGGSHDDDINFEMELSRNWHWMWSTFYFHKKYEGFFLSFVKSLPKLFSALFKFLIFLIILKKEKKKIYYSRLSGLINSILLNKSWYRPKIDKSWFFLIKNINISLWKMIN